MGNFSFDLAGSSQSTEQRLQANILPLVSDEETKELLTEWLEDHDEFRPVELKSTVEDTDFDVCIIDEAAFQAYLEQLRDYKKEVAPILAPYLLLVPQSGPSLIETDRGEIVDNVLTQTIDEVVTTPIQQSELNWRINALLRLRSQSFQSYEQEQRYRSLFNSIRDAILVADRDRRIVNCNPAFTDLFGYELSEIAGKPTAYVYENEAEFEQMGEAIADHIGDPKFTHTIQYETKSGDVFPGETNVFYLRDTNDDIRGFIGLIRDISDRLQRQRQLRQYEYAIEGATDMLAAADTDHQLLFANQSYRDFHGLSVDDVEDTTLEDHLGQDAFEDVKPHFDAVLAGNTVQYEIVRSNQDGEDRFLDIQYYPLETDDTEVVGVVAAMRDVTERETRKQDLKRFQRAVEAAGHAIYITDSEGTIEYVNPAFEEITGYAGTEAVGMTPRILKSGEMPDGYYEQLWGTVLSGSVWSEQVINTRKSGDQYHAQQTIAPITGDDGTVEAFVAIQTDITEQVETAENLKLFEDIAQRIDDPIMLQDLAGNYQFINTAVADYANWPADDLIGMDESAFMDHQQAARIAEKKRQVIESEQPVTYEIETSLPGKGDRIFRTSRYPHYDIDGNLDGTIAICRDITDIKERENHLKVFDRLLRHNIHNKMNVILGQADIIANDATEGVDEPIRRIRQAGSSLVELADKERQIITLLESEPQIRTLDLCPIIKYIIKDIGNDHPEADVSYDCEDGLQVSAVTALEDGLYELVENAIIHTDGRQPRVDVTATVAGETVTITVADNGPGIPKTEQLVLKEQTDITPLFHGTGIGLWLVNHVVLQSGGTLRFQDRDQRGSIVEVRLPIPQATR